MNSCSSEKWPGLSPTPQKSAQLLTFGGKCSLCAKWCFVLFSRRNIKKLGRKRRPALCTRSCLRLWTLCTLKRFQSCRVRCVQVQHDAFRDRHGFTSTESDVGSFVHITVAVWYFLSTEPSTRIQRELTLLMGTNWWKRDCYESKTNLFHTFKPLCQFSLCSAIFV